jgi:retinol dehydrogenase 12
VISSKETHLDVLFNSAGVMKAPIDQLTEDGYDLQFGTNVIGHGVLTLELLPLLLEGAKRYVRVASHQSMLMRVIT